MNAGTLAEIPENNSRENLMKSVIRQYIFLIISGAIIVAGIVSIAITVVAFFNDGPFKNRIILKEYQELNLEKGKYSMFYEYNSEKVDLGILEVTKETRYSNISENIEFHIFNVIDGKEIIVHKDPSMTFTFEDTKGESLYSFEITDVGEYTIEMRQHNKEFLATISMMKSFTNIISSLFKRMGVFILISVPFMLIGWFMYSKENKRRRISA